MDSITLTLAAPIQSQGQTVTALTLRPMTGRDLRLCGFPYSFSEDGLRTLNMESLARHIAALGGIPPSSVDQLTPRDMVAASNAALSFMNESVPVPVSLPA